MLPLVVTILLAIYVLGPDLVSRWLIGFTVPRRAVVQSRSEEWARSLLWCFVPFWIAFQWAWYLGGLRRLASVTQIETLYSGITSDAFFGSHRDEFFRAVGAFFWINWTLLWRLYLIVVAVSAVMMLLVRFYGSIRKRLERYSWLQSLLAILVLPRVSDWHVLLSRMLVPSKEERLFVDLLTKGDQLYQGRLADKTLGPDGSLVNITLAGPSKFQRSHYLEAMKADPKVRAEAFWKRIPGDIFVVMASEITSINVRFALDPGENRRSKVLEALEAVLKKRSMSQPN